MTAREGQRAVRMGRQLAGVMKARTPGTVLEVAGDCSSAVLEVGVAAGSESMVDSVAEVVRLIKVKG